MGKKHGKGKYKTKNGIVFDGTWKYGNRHGKGKLIYPGAHHEVHWEWRNGNPVSYV